MNHETPTQLPADLRLESRTQQIMEDLDSQPDFRTVKLVADEVLDLPKPGVSGEPMSTMLNASEGIRQDLVGVVKAGPELFGIVRVTLSEKDQTQPSGFNLTEGVGVTRFGRDDDDKATLLGFVEPARPVIVGRRKQQDLDEQVSRAHFVVARAGDGSIGILDLHSSNGTTIVVHESTVDKFGIKDLDPKPGSQIGAHNPVRNYKLWSADSAKLRPMLQTTGRTSS